MKQTYLIHWTSTIGLTVAVTLLIVAKPIEYWQKEQAKYEGQTRATDRELIHYEEYAHPKSPFVEYQVDGITYVKWLPSRKAVRLWNGLWIASTNDFQQDRQRCDLRTNL